MPLGIFGSSNKDGGPKPQPLTSGEEKPQKKDKCAAGSSGTSEKDMKGSSIKLSKKTYTVERKLAEGGFAIVYLVTDKHSRNYALKRQLIRDDPRQVEACRTESQIVKNLNGHKNIVAHVDNQLTVNKAGVYDYMLLTVYYPTNVLQLMNSRLLLNKWLNSGEILDIFCDICEAVARLHHSKTPVIHRDLKVENILIDQRTGTEKPVYVLCDFGSATTKVLSKEHYTHAFLEEEIQRYTTLSYRAPEMIDLYSGVEIGTKSDVWALGVLLYKLCYFSLPFGESALAIQSGIFSFPEAPSVPEEIKSIINLLLTLSARYRPNIFQTAYLAFSAANKKCPVYNIEKSPRIELSEAVQILRLRNKLGADYARLYEKAFNDFEAQKRRHTAPSVGNGSDNSSSERPKNSQQQTVGTFRQQQQRQQVQETKQTANETSDHVAFVPDQISAAAPASGDLPTEGVIVNTAAESHPREMTTSVNPRLRPKPQVISSVRQHQTAAMRTASAVSSFIRPVSNSASTTLPSSMKIAPYQQQQHPQNQSTSTATGEWDLTQQGLEERRHSPPSANAKSDGIGLHSSAFRPYTLANKQEEVPAVASGDEEISKINGPMMVFESSNPFIQQSSSIDQNMDDNLFGERFDKLRRYADSHGNPSPAGGTAPDPEPARSQTRNVDASLPTAPTLDWTAFGHMISDDPFGNAPDLLPHQFYRRPK